IASMLDDLVDDETQHRIVFKGGAALELRFGFKARSTKDLDLIFRGEDLKEAVALITAAAKGGSCGFSGKTTEPERITTTTMANPPVRFHVKLAYLSRAFITIPMELSAAEARSVDAPDVLPVAVSLAPVQLLEPRRVPFLLLRYQIAQKLHACSEVLEDD